MTMPLARLAAALALLACAACRQEDIREMTLDLPGLSPIAGDAAALAAAEARVKAAFATYERHAAGAAGESLQAGAMTGIDLDSLRLTSSPATGAVTLALRYDSLLVARMNVIALLEGLVITNATPDDAAPQELPTGVRPPALRRGAPAGYLDTRPPAATP